jgi:hypothetical protein
VERAKAASPAFDITEGNAAAVAAICWRLAGLPLALELAAAGSRYLSPQTLLSRLDRALSAGWARDLPERQRTMRATLDWSYGLLSAPEQALFRRLSVFAGGFTLEAAEAIGATPGKVEEVADTDDGVLELLGRLVEQSLVSVTQPPTGEEGLRYGMLEPLRQYELEKLEEAGETDATRSTHAAFFLALAERAYPDLRTEQQVGWFERFEREHDNLRAALARMLEEGEAEQMVRVGWSIWLFWVVRGHTGEGRRLMEEALAAGSLGRGHGLPDAVRARALLVIAILSFARGEIGRVSATAEESLSAARAAGDGGLVLLSLMMRGYARLNAGELDAAEEDLMRGLEMFRELYGRRGTAFGINGLAQVALARGEFDLAADLLTEAEAELRTTRDWFTLTSNLNTQALAARLRGNEEQAAALLRESLELAATLRDAWGVVLCCAGLAGVAARLGETERAARLFGVAEALREKTGAGVSWPAWRELYVRDMTAARELLGVEAFEAAWMEGRALTFDEAVVYAHATAEQPEG